MVKEAANLRSRILLWWYVLCFLINIQRTAQSDEAQEDQNTKSNQKGDDRRELGDAAEKETHQTSNGPHDPNLQALYRQISVAQLARPDRGAESHYTTKGQVGSQT